MDAHPAKRKALELVGMYQMQTLTLIGFGAQSWASSTAESALLKENYCSRGNMLSTLPRILLALLFLSSIAPKSDGQFEEWCIADEQTPAEELQRALDWACGNGADCRKIQVNQPCYLPNTVKDHASFAFNSYYQKLKHKGASCYFNAAALITALDPSHGSCKYEVLS